jgi:hypothetical protein
MAYYNNLLSVPILLAGAALKGEYATFASHPELHTPGYVVSSDNALECVRPRVLVSPWSHRVRQRLG